MTEHEKQIMRLDCLRIAAGICGQSTGLHVVQTATELLAFIEGDKTEIKSK